MIKVINPGIAYRKTMLLFLLFCTATSFSQDYNCSSTAMQLKIMPFLLEHLDSIKKYTDEDVMVISVGFEKNFTADVKYYTEKLYEDDDEDHREQYRIAIGYTPLKAFIMHHFRYCPVDSFGSGTGELTSLTFRVPLTKKEIDAFLAELLEDRDHNPKYKQVALNADYHIDLNQFNLTGAEEIPKKTITGKLHRYMSDIIRLSDKTYLVFRVMKTSDYNDVYDTIEYALYHIYGDQNGKRISQGKTSREDFSSYLIKVNDEDLKARMTITFE